MRNFELEALNTKETKGGIKEHEGRNNSVVFKLDNLNYFLLIKENDPTLAGVYQLINRMLNF